MQDKRMPTNARQPRNIKDDMGMDGTAFQVTESKAMVDKWPKVTRKLQDLYVKQVNNGGKNTSHCRIKGNRAGLGRNNKKFEKK